MSKDQGYGFVIFIISIIVAIVYLAAFFAPFIGLEQSQTFGLHELAIGIPVLLFVLLVLVISGWIGWTMLTTPPPTPLESEPTTPSSSDEVDESKSTSQTRRKKK